MPVSLGKKFEALIASQFDDCGVCFDRFKDDTAGYKGIRNICDFVVFFNGYLIYIECKTIHGKSFNFKNLTDNQYNGLQNKSSYNSVIAGILLWFVDEDLTIFVPARVLYMLKEVDEQKSIKINDLPGGCIVFKGKKKRTFFEYDIKHNLQKIIEDRMKYGN